MSSASLLDGKAVMADRLASFAVPLEPHELPAAIDVIVRVVLSDIMAPSDSLLPQSRTSPGSRAGCWPRRR